MTQDEIKYISERMDAGASLLPEHMIGAVKRYVLNRIPPGSFLSAVICNDLREAVGRADDENARSLSNWVRFFYNYTPSGCWGSPDNFRRWLSNEGDNA